MLSYLGFVMKYFCPKKGKFKEMWQNLGNCCICVVSVWKLAILFPLRLSSFDSFHNKIFLKIKKKKIQSYGLIVPTLGNFLVRWELTICVNGGIIHTGQPSGPGGVGECQLEGTIHVSWGHREGAPSPWTHQCLVPSPPKTVWWLFHRLSLRTSLVSSMLTLRGMGDSFQLPYMVLERCHERL